MARKKMVAGNWKMNMDVCQTKKLLAEIKNNIGKDNEVVFCVPAIDISAAVEELKDTGIGVGAQNIHYIDSGAYTGEISADMVKNAGADYVIIGHSERREYFGETDETVNLKTLKAIEKGLVPIVCVGETLEQREQGITVDLVRMQTKIAMQNVSKEDAVKCVVAYEPIWAIGTGKTATNEQAEEVCKAIREVLAEIYCQNTADQIRILYGGSVNAGNSKELFAMANIDGGLVGGASLKADFAEVANS